jgi:hypothetical protein
MRGLAPGPPHPYLGAAMSFLSRFSPLRAFRDLRSFLASRKPYEVGFMALAIAVTWTVMLVFARDTHVEPDYREPEIVYVQNYKADRSDADIKAQQKLDLPEEQARKDAIIEAQRKRQQQFKRIDDALNAWGI